MNYKFLKGNIFNKNENKSYKGQKKIKKNLFKWMLKSVALFLFSIQSLFWQVNIQRLMKKGAFELS